MPLGVGPGKYVLNTIYNDTVGLVITPKGGWSGYLILPWPHEKIEDVGWIVFRARKQQVLSGIVWQTQGDALAEAAEYLEKQKDKQR